MLRNEINVGTIGRGRFATPVGSGRTLSPIEYAKSFDRLFDDMDFIDLFQSPNSLKTNIYKEDDLYTIEVEVPGVKKEDIDIKLEDKHIVISVETKSEKEKENKKCVFSERSLCKQSRSIYVDDVSNEDIKAKLDSGILTITIKKKPKDTKDNKSITIE